MAGRLGISTPAVSKAVARGAVIAERNGYKIVPSYEINIFISSTVSLKKTRKTAEKLRTSSI
jgi:hypothetical protein